MITIIYSCYWCKEQIWPCVISGVNYNTRKSVSVTRRVAYHKRVYLVFPWDSQVPVIVLQYISNNSNLCIRTPASPYPTFPWCSAILIVYIRALESRLLEIFLWFDVPRLIFRQCLIPSGNSSAEFGRTAVFITIKQKAWSVLPWLMTACTRECPTRG